MMEAIGTIRTPYKTKQDCPIQPLYAASFCGRVEVLERYADGLKDRVDCRQTVAPETGRPRMMSAGIEQRRPASGGSRRRGAFNHREFKHGPR